MAHHKKKPTGHQLQKLAVAQYKKEFFRKLKLIINTYCGEDIYSLIPQNVLEMIYMSRSHSFKYVVAEGHEITSKALDNIKRFLPLLFKAEKIALTSQGHEISIHDFYTIVYTIITHSTIIEKEKYAVAEKVIAAFKRFAADELFYKNAHEKLWAILHTYGMAFNTIDVCLYWLDHKTVTTTKFEDGIQNIIEVRSVVPETRSVKIDGINRPVVRVGWAFAHAGPEWASIKPSLFNINSPFADIPLDVYIQSHALERLSERMDCFWTGYAHANMHISIRDTKVFYDNNNKILIEYRLDDVKAGYFRADIIDGIILIRTFLFITHNGTPEGEKLIKNTGLQKLDIKYLAIDKLSTFMSYDIGDNEEIKKIFREAGCQCLIDLYGKAKTLDTIHGKQAKSSIIIDYIKQGNLDIPSYLLEEELQEK